MHSENFRGAVFMVFSMALFAVEDALVKLLSQGLPFAQVLAMLGAAGCLSFALLLKLRGGVLFTRDLYAPVVMLRNLGEIAGSTAVVAALALGDLASTTAILQAMPLAIVLGAVLFLREPVGWRRGSALIVGFMGVLMVIRPGMAAFQTISLLPLLAVVSLAMRDIVTRRLPAHIQSEQVAVGAFASLTLSGVVLMVLLDQRPAMPHALQWAGLAGTTVAGVSAYALLVTATRISEAASVAPYRYSRLLFALILAVVIFGERPDAMTLLGGAVIVASGCYTMLREARLRRRMLREAGLTVPGPRGP